MAGQRLTDKTALANNPTSSDLLMVVDVSDTTGSAAGTSKKVISEYVLATERVDVSNVEFLALNTTGKTLVAAKGANKVIIPESVYCEYTEGGTPNTATVYPTIGFIDQSAKNYWDQQRFAFDSPTYNGISWVFSGGNPSASGVNPLAGLSDLPLIFYFGGTPTATSTGIIKIWTTFRIIDIS